jgi:long-chain acyl-CoA synthetase
MPDQQAQPDTFPRLLAANAERLRGRPAIREKDLGIWQTWTWDEVAAEVRALACGLAALGFKRGDTLAIIGDNRPRLYWAMAAAQSLGGVPVPLYQDAVANEMVYVFEDAQARFAIVEDQEQVDKLLEIMPRCSLLEHIIYDDPRGMRHYHASQLRSYDALIEQGRAFDAAHADYYAGEVALGRPSDVGIMLYTSGTTG